MLTSSEDNRAVGSADTEDLSAPKIVKDKYCTQTVSTKVDVSKRYGRIGRNLTNSEDTRAIRSVHDQGLSITEAVKAEI